MIVKKKFIGSNKVGQPPKYNFVELKPGECLVVSVPSDFILPMPEEGQAEDAYIKHFVKNTMKSRVTVALHNFKKKYAPGWETAVVANLEKLVIEVYRIK